MVSNLFLTENNHPFIHFTIFTNENVEIFSNSYKCFRNSCVIKINNYPSIRKVAKILIPTQTKFHYCQFSSLQMKSDTQHTKHITAYA